jgi:fatty acid desaturase
VTGDDPEPYRRLRSALRVGVLVTLVCVVVGFWGLWCLRHWFIPAGWPLVELVVAVAGGLLTGFASAGAGLLAGRLWWFRHRRR